MKKLPAAKAHQKALLALGLSLLAYFAGLTLLFIPVVILCLAIWTPFPPLFKSWFSRAVAATVVLFALLQVAALVQFFVFPGTGFSVVALLLGLIVAALVLFFERNRVHRGLPWLDGKDYGAFLVAGLFIAPFAYLCLHTGTMTGIGQFAGIQVSDGVNHYMAVSEMSTAQHLTYRTVDYYPKGFHIATAFVQDSFFLNPASVSWKVNAVTFVAQYVVFGSLLAYVLFYFCRFAYEAFGGQKGRLANLTLALALGVPLSLLYLQPFIRQGFLNYFYVCAVFVLGVLYLYAFAVQAKARGQLHARWFMLVYLLMAFAIGMSWPLLTPPLVLVAALFLLPVNLKAATLLAPLRDTRNWPVVGGFALQLVPLYLHFRYSALTAEQGLTALGSIRAFHYGVLLAGIALVTFVTLYGRFDERFRTFVANVAQPFYLFLGAIVAWHFLRVGELRYYAIKVGYLIELLLVALAAALLVQLCMSGKLPRLHKVLLPVAALTMSVMLLTGITANPLHDVREMYRNISNFGTPAFYESDVSAFTSLGISNQLDNGNNTVVHYDPQSGNLAGNMLVANWANVMNPSPDPDQRALRCSGQLFPITMYQETSPAQQESLVAKVRECIGITQASGRQYFIVTDDGSVGHLRGLFGNDVRFVTR